MVFEALWRSVRDFIKLDGRPLLPKGYLGNVSMQVAKEKAASEIAVYKARLRLEKEAAGEREVGKLLEKARTLAAEKRTERKARKTTK